MYRTHPQEIVEQKLSELRPLNYNQFRWWRRWDSKRASLPNKASLLDKIQNGDLDFSHYFWQAQYTEIEMNQKYTKAKDYRDYLDNVQLDKARRKRLWEDFIKDEDEKLEYIAKQFQKLFFITEKEYQKEIEEFDGTLEEFYHHCQTLYNKRPQPKSRRGRPPKK